MGVMLIYVMVVIYLTWEDVRRELKKHEYGTKLEIQKWQICDSSGQLQPTVVGDGLLRGAIRQYRDRRRRDSLHVLEYEDRFEVHLERFNPIYHPIEHLIYDAPNWGLVGLICLGWLMSSKNNQNTS